MCVRLSICEALEGRVMARRMKKREMCGEGEF